MSNTEFLPQPQRTESVATRVRNMLGRKPAAAETTTTPEYVSPLDINDIYVQGYSGDFGDVDGKDGTMHAVYDTNNQLVESTTLDELPSTVRETLHDKRWALTGQAPKFKIESDKLVIDKEAPSDIKGSRDEHNAPPSILHIDGYTLFSFGAGKNPDTDAITFAVKGDVPSAEFRNFVDRHFGDVLDSRENRGLVMDVDEPPQVGYFYLDDYREDQGLELVEKDVPEQPTAKDVDKKFTAPSPMDGVTEPLAHESGAEAQESEPKKGGLLSWLGFDFSPDPDKKDKKKDDAKKKKVKVPKFSKKDKNPEQSEFDLLFSEAAEDEVEASAGTKTAEPATTESEPAWPTEDDAVKAETTDTDAVDDSAEDFAWPTEADNTKAEKAAKGTLFERINNQIMMGLPKRAVETGFLGERKLNKRGKAALIGAVGVIAAWYATKGFTEIPFVSGTGSGANHAVDTANNVHAGGAGPTVTETAPSGTGAPAPTEAAHASVTNDPQEMRVGSHHAASEAAHPAVGNDPQEMRVGSHAGTPAPEVSHPTNTGGTQDLPRSAGGTVDALPEQNALAPLPENYKMVPEGGNVWDTSHDVLKYYGYAASDAQVDTLKDFLLGATRTTEETARHMHAGQKLPIPNPEQLRQLIGDIK